MMNAPSALLRRSPALVRRPLPASAGALHRGRVNGPSSAAHPCSTRRAGFFPWGHGSFPHGVRPALYNSDSFQSGRGKA